MLIQVLVHSEPGYLESYFAGEISNCSGLSILNDDEMGTFLTGITDRVFLSDVRNHFCVDLGIEIDNITKNFAVVCDKLLEKLDQHTFFSSVQTRFQHDRNYIFTVSDVLTPDACDWSRLLGFYAFVGIVSLLCLLAALYVYIVIKEYATLHGKIVIANIISTVLVHIFYLIVFNKQSQDPHDDGRVGVHMTVHDNSGCVALGYFGYLANLLMFSWMTVMCLDLTWTFYMGKVIKGGQKKKVRLYFCTGNGIPIIFTIFAGVLQVRGRKVYQPK